MEKAKVSLIPLETDDREQFILDNQWAFKYGAMIEFGERDNHFEEDGEIISRKTIEESIDAENSETYRIITVCGGIFATISGITSIPERRLRPTWKMMRFLRWPMMP